MSGNWAISWVADRLRSEPEFDAVDLTSNGLLEITRNGRSTFKAAVLGIEDQVKEDHVTPFFNKSEHPEFVVNVPSKAIWTGPAINFIHRNSAAFGGMGDLHRASSEVPVSSYRFRNYRFVEEGLSQHSAVSEVTRLYDRMFMVERHSFPDLKIVLIDAYEMSAEDVRLARKRYGQFDAALKMTSYGEITTAAIDAAKSMSADTFMWRDLLSRLNKP